MNEQVLHYRIERRLGAGGMGEVFLARDTRLDRAVALKFLVAGRAGDPTARERLLREARAASRLNHPGILAVYAVESHEDGDFLVMEYVEGRTLRDLIAAGGMALPRALDLCIQVAEGLAAAHEMKVIHRDVKPDNVLVDARGRARVMDFGLSLVTDATRMTQEGNASGTLAYMSPEQARARDLDGRTDIFSFGILLHEVVTGRLPFRSDPGSPASALFAILNEPQEPLAIHRPDAPEALQHILDRALEKDREKRYPSMGALIEDLKVVRRGLDSGEFAPLPSGEAAAAPRPSTGSVPASSAAPESSPAPAASGRGRTLFTVGLVALCAASAAFLAMRGGSEPQDAATTKSPPASVVETAAAPPKTVEPPAPPVLRVLRQRLLPIPGDGASEPTISPDGSQIAFVMKDDNGVKQIWMRSLDEGDPIAITRDTVDCTAPVWAPRGGLIVYCRDEGFLGTPILRLNSVWLVAPPTGSPRRILQHGYNPSFSPDGKRVLFQDYRGIHTVNLEGGDPQAIEGLPEMKYPMPVRRPRFSPDGARIAFFHNDLGPAGDYWVVNADGSGLLRLTHRTDMGGGFCWAPDGNSLIVAAAWGGATNLWRVPVDGGDPTPVTSGAGEDTEPVVSGDGRNIVFSNARHEYALKVLDLGTRKVRTIREARSNMGVPEFSPDGSSIAFFGGEEPGSHLLAVDRDGRNLRSLTRGPGEFHLFPQWSADGRGLYFYKKALDGASTWEWTALGGGESKVLRPGWTVHLQVFARVSPNGKRVVYLENRGLSTLPATRVEDLESGEATDLPQVLLYPRWSPDGESLLGFGLTGSVTVYEFATNKARPLAPGFGCNWSRDGKHVYYLSKDTEATPDGGKHALFRIPAEGGEPERIAAMGTIHPFSAIFDIGTHDDLAWVDFREGRKELWVLELE